MQVYFPQVLLINISDAGEEAHIDGTDYAPLSSLAIAPSLSHRIYALIGLAWPAFGLLFLIMLCSNDWFALGFSVQWLFPIVCLGALLLGHLMGLTLESRAVTWALYHFRRGMPLIFYRRFVLVQSAAPGRQSEGSTGVEDGTSNVLNRGQPAIIFGAKRIMLSAVDELHLTFLGVLEIKSYAASGKVMTARARADDTPTNKADLLARVPIGALTLGDQKRFVEIFRESRPDLIVNKRLDQRLNSPIVKGQAIIQSIGAVILIYALFDVGYATFSWLEMLKDYYGSQLCMRHPDKAKVFLGDPAKELAKAKAQDLYDLAEQLRTHPSAISWAYRALFVNGHSAAQLLAIRAETLYWLGRKDEAIEVLKNTLLLKPTGYKIQLQLARWLAGAGRVDQAREVLDKVLEKHKDVLLPRLYNEALIFDDGQALRSLYKRYLAELDDEVFGDEPGWPPGSEKPLLETWRRDDLEFLGRYLIVQPAPGSHPDQK